MSPAELTALWNGWLWRRSRDMEVTAKCFQFLFTALGGTLEGDVAMGYDDALKMLPGYDGEYMKMQQAKGPRLMMWDLP